ncbi:TetR/AcrR family transcriptional regulator [Allopusillimonas soli]|uniref:TetR/AcrR family transcriptional regulator n=1 Tax=Allopusillimonas soli TaxID=659016 RepID=A0A853FAZ9_9BURK|nr:TetR/AcrR family transcriptional regulator [Allopusillimonas soli]NYT37273.1 TetR/AcrR family transcriptional regulator [Allopusillimonas soli]TEA74732.1 TetR/AcrR family transcriptional regulator [Allopusillimonas soli]
MSQPQKNKRGRPSARDKILDAALDVISEVGTTGLTLDAVASRCGISKGGLLYHFPFKEQLLYAANEQLVRRRLAARAVEEAILPDTPSRELKAYVMASVNNRSGNDFISTRMLAVGSLADESAEPIRQYFKDRFPPFEEKVGFDRAALVHVATEGLWFMEMLHLSPFSPEQRERLVHSILALADADGKQADKNTRHTKTGPSVKKYKNRAKETDHGN